MRKLLSLLLILATLISVPFTLISCAQVPPDNTDEGGGITDTPGDNDDSDEPTGTIVVPEYRDYGRDTVNFADMSYTRPNIEKAVEKFRNVIEIIEKNEIEYTHQLEKIEALDPIYIEIVSMSSLASIYSYRDASDKSWSDETLYIDTSYPGFSRAVEDLFVAAAASEHKDSFANDYFGEELYEYEDGGIYTDELVELMEDEAKLENDYNTLSTDSVTLKYEHPLLPEMNSGTYEEYIAALEAACGSGTALFTSAKDELDAIYEDEITRLTSGIFVELIKVRRLISNELGYESYREYAYETIYHDYEHKSFLTFAGEVKSYVIPVYVTLSNYLFAPYISSYEGKHSMKGPGRAELINSLYGVYGECGDKFSEIYSYMLQHGLYDIEKAKDNRYEGAFTSYIEKYNSPFVFVSMDGTAMDYMTLSHEFGHFVDEFVNYGGSSSLDLAEVSSQALEMLTLTKLSGKLDEDTSRYLTYIKLDELLSTIIFQTFYASVEDEIYKLEYNDITRSKLDAVVANVAKDFGLSSAVNSIEFILIPHTILYPFYVQSYATSATVAIEIFCMEKAEAGSGFEAYLSLIERESDETFEKTLEDASLTSPFADGALRRLSDRIYYYLVGAHFFESPGNNVA